MNFRMLNDVIESVFPSVLQESWDNTGWNIELHNDTIEGILVCLDVTTAAIAAARKLKCSVIISHHPLLFHPLKCVNANTSIGARVTDLIRSGISLYCAHTSADSAGGGINTWLGDALDLAEMRPLVRRNARLYKVAVSVPIPHADAVWKAMVAAGAGNFRGYSDCTFSVDGTSTFRPSEKARPAVGSAGILEIVPERRIEALVTENCVDAVTDAVRRAHPYEVPALDVFPLRDAAAVMDGLGIVGELSEPLSLGQLLQRIHQRWHTGVLRCRGSLDSRIHRVGICGGAGHDLIEPAVKAGCDVFITGELRHNSYYDNDIALVEAGHYDTEKCFVSIVTQALQMSDPVITYKVAVHGFESDARPYIDC